MLFGAIANNRTLGNSRLIFTLNRLAILKQQLPLWVVRNCQRWTSECLAKWFS